MNIKTLTLSIVPLFLKKYFIAIEVSPLGYRIAKGAFWALVGSVIARALMLVATIPVARMLGSNVYGELGIIQSTVGLFGVLVGFGLGLTATKYVAEFRQTNPARAGRIIKLSGLFAMITGGLMAMCLLILAPWFAERTINAPHLIGPLRVGAVILFLGSITDAQTGALVGLEAFKTIARVNFLVGLFYAPALIIGAWLGGLFGAVLSLAVAMCFNLLLNSAALRSEAWRSGILLKPKKYVHEWPILLKFSLPAALSNAMVGPVNWFCNVMLVNQANGYAEMGIFNAGNQWRMAILFIPSALAQIVLPMLSNLNAANQRSDYLFVLKCNTLINGGVALFIAFIVMICAHMIIKLYGPGFESGISVLTYLSLSAVFMSLNSAVGQIIASRGNMWYGFLFNALWAVALIVSALWFFHHGYGAIGLAAASLFAYILHTIWQGIYIYKFLKL